MPPNHLYKRNNQYYFRMRVPNDLRHIIPATEIKKSLRSETYCSAKLLAKQWECKTEEVFLLLRSDILDEQQQLEVAGRLLHRKPVRPAYTAPVTVEMESKAVVKTNNENHPQKLLSQVVDEYIQDRKYRWSSKTLVEYESAYQVILKVMGDRDIRNYERSDLINFRDTILRLPPNLTKKAEFKGKTIQQIVELPNLDRISDKTANGYLVNTAAVFKWAVKQGYLETNYADGLSLPEGKTRSDLEREAYSQDDLKRLLRTEPYVGSTRHAEPEKYWIPLIALYSGMRLNEVCQLRTEDVVVIDGVSCFDVNEKQDKQVKTTSSVRIVPIHPELIKLGLIKYAEQMRKLGADRLWPNLRKYREGYSKHFGRWYSEMNRNEITGNRKRCFHSFRHTFIDHLKQAGVQDTLISEIVGHANNSITMGRYGKRYQPKVLLEAMLNLDYGVSIPKWK